MANTAFADPIEPFWDTGGAISFPMNYGAEEHGSSFLYGYPLQVIAADGGVGIWSGTVGAGNLILGIAAQNAQNLGTTGAGAPVGFSPITSYGSVVGNYLANGTQSAAYISPPMTPISDGYTYWFVAAPTTVFRARIGSSSGGTNPVATVITQRGAPYGLTQDAVNSYWFVDTNKSNSVTVVGFDPLDSIGTTGGHVLFVFNPATAVGDFA
jgi:hypothetical protein